MKRIGRVLVVVALLGGSLATGHAAAAGERAEKRWDRRIAPIAKRVERLRGLEFEHPVPVVFMGDERFERELRGMRLRHREAESTTSVLHKQVVLRALNLLASGESLKQLGGLVDFADVLAVYDQARERVYVRGRNVGVGSEVTLAHELTHVLQHQHFPRVMRLRQPDLDVFQVADALIEGDAMRIARAYAATLSPAEQREAAEHEIDLIEETTGPDAAYVLFAVWGSPYLFGPHLIRGLEIQGGERAIDRAFTQVPRHQVALLNPLRVGKKALPTTKPVRRRREKQIGPVAPIGAMTLYSALAARLDTAYALNAADEWRGSAARAFTRPGEYCIRANFRAGDLDGATFLAEALQAWADAGESGVATVRQAGWVVTLEACDVGGIGYGWPSPDEVISVALLRNARVLQELADGTDELVAKCVGDGVIVDQAWAEAFAALAEQDELDLALLRTLEERVDAIRTDCEATA
jgi:hypothetical protein